MKIRNKMSKIHNDRYCILCFEEAIGFSMHYCKNHHKYNMKNGKCKANYRILTVYQ